MAISVNHLNVTLQATIILSDVGFKAEQSKTVGLLGPNGSGKSTLIRTLAGLIPAAGSNISITGELLNKLPRKALAKRLACVPQHAQTEDELTVRDIISLGRTPNRGLFDLWSKEDNAAVSDAITLMQLEHLVKRQWHRLS
jgi:iron complex transport system ATP-binding protein